MAQSRGRKNHDWLKRAVNFYKQEDFAVPSDEMDDKVAIISLV